MVGVTSIEVKENLDELKTQLRQASNPKLKEKLQVLYWLKHPQAPSISAINCSSSWERPQYSIK